MTTIIPTILTRDIRTFRRKLSRYRRFSRIQIDVMDGRFVPYRSAAVRQMPAFSRQFVEAHLMIEHPEQHIAGFFGKGFSLLLFHYEAVEKKNILSLIRRIHSAGLQAGIAINPKTPASALKPYLRTIDQVTVMGVEPGRNAAPFLPQTLNKVRWLRKQRNCPPIEFDGGASQKTIRAIADAGAQYIASGSFIGRFRDPKKGVALLRAALE
ncbi:ribulose-phosphate 3-epimerase [Candidatus Woesearchaeota archaeon]|nr:ribulose-phosphate 3-epimerase [Candidatus Woesearchaeota archaeon]